MIRIIQGFLHWRLECSPIICLLVSYTVLYMVIALITFDYGMWHHSRQFYSTNTSTIPDSITYRYNHSYTISISIVCQYSIGCIFSWLAVLVSVYNEYRVRGQRRSQQQQSSRSGGQGAARAPWGDVEMRARYGPQTEEYNRYQERERNSEM